MDNKNKFVILISGKAGAGKTTTANFMRAYLNELEPNSAVLWPFAGSLKGIARGYFTWDGEKDDRGRKLLQDIGRIGREYYKDVWVEKVEDKVRTSPYFLADDWRFPNEFDYFYQRGYNVVTIRINRPGHNILNAELALDVSEISLSEYPSDYDFYILNDGTLEELEATCFKIAYIVLRNLETNKNEKIMVHR